MRERSGTDPWVPASAGKPIVGLNGRCDAGDGRSFEIVNFMEILGEGLALYSEDLYKRLKLIGDIDEMIVETAPLIEANRLDLDTVRDALFAEFGANAGS